MLTDVCAYCGDACSEQTRFCPECWGRAPMELRDRVTSAFCADAFGPRFQNAVKGVIKFLVWLDAPEELS